MTSSLVLKTVNHPAAPGFKVEVFGDSEAACSHLRDHLLSYPECFGWGLLDPVYPDIVDLENPDTRWRYVCEVMSSEGGVAQDLYDIYFQVISEELRDANQLGWHASEGGVTVALGTGGVLTVIEGKQIKTAFLPGLGSADATKKARKRKGKAEVFLRESQLREPDLKRGNKSRDRKQKEVLWTFEQRLYFKVFKPAVKFIRKSHCGNGKLNGEGPRRHYALLKECLPAMKELSFDNWLKLRKGLRADRGGEP